jgi:DNA repair protein RecN (Recombination protein N)
MLQSLKIQNYALIDEIYIEFYPGFLTITGETGAGKSILIGALSLILGNRADTNVLKDETRKCVVEVSFKLKNSRIKEIFTKYDLDFDQEIIIRREINSKGKSRAFVNDTPVNVKVLKELGDHLVDIHSQHQNLILRDNVFQLNVVDSYANHEALLSKYHNQYREFRTIQNHYKELHARSEQAGSDYDYYQFQYNQLEKVNLQDGEQEELESELETLHHAEEIKSNLSHASHLLNNEEASILSQVREACDCLRKIVDFFPKVKEISERLESSHVELQDLSNEMEVLNENVAHDPNRIELIRQRLDEIYSLEHKHHVASENELISIKNELGNKLEEIDQYDFRLEELEKELEDKRRQLNASANSLSESRKKSIPAIEKRITSMLREVGIPHAAFKIRRTDLEDFNEYGRDHVRFLFSANKNVELEDIARVASGGEVSRLMLSLKSTLAETKAVPTIIFDEIDSGTSGEIADRVGNIMKTMAENMQILNITHLPQIASKGDYHYKVYKKDDHQSTHTYIKQLNSGERIEEIAKMLSGEELTETALRNAREFLQDL